MSEAQFEAKCRAALFWTVVVVIAGEYTCRDAPFEEPAWLAAGIVLACLGVLFGRAYLRTAVSAATSRVHPEKLSAALARLGFVSIAGTLCALIMVWKAESPMAFNAGVVIGEFTFGFFVLWTEFWFRRFFGEEDAEPAVRK